MWEPVLDSVAGNPLICRQTPVVEVPDATGVSFDLLFDLSVGLTLRPDLT